MYVAMFVYAWRKSDGGLFAKAMQQDLQNGAQAKRPCMRTLHWARTLGGVQLHVEGSTLIAKARSRVLTRFLASDHDVLLMIDEDIDAPRDAIMVMQAHVERTRGVALGVCALSDTGGPNCWSLDGKNVGGVAFAAIHMEAAMKVALPMMRVRDADGSPLVPAFAEHIGGGEWGRRSGPAPHDAAAKRRRLYDDGPVWYGEDVSFCLRAHSAGVLVDALKLPGLLHDGREVDYAASIDPKP